MGSLHGHRRRVVVALTGGSMHSVTGPTAAFVVVLSRSPSGSAFPSCW